MLQRTVITLSVFQVYAQTQQTNEGNPANALVRFYNQNVGNQPWKALLTKVLTLSVLPLRLCPAVSWAGTQLNQFRKDPIKCTTSDELSLFSVVYSRVSSACGKTCCHHLWEKLEGFCSKETWMRHLLYHKHICTAAQFPKWFEGQGIHAVYLRRDSFRI